MLAPRAKGGTGWIGISPVYVSRCSLQRDPLHQWRSGGNECGRSEPFDSGTTKYPFRRGFLVARRFYDDESFATEWILAMPLFVRVVARSSKGGFLLGLVLGNNRIAPMEAISVVFDARWMSRRTRSKDARCPRGVVRAYPSLHGLGGRIAWPSRPFLVRKVPMPFVRSIRSDKSPHLVPPYRRPIRKTTPLFARSIVADVGSRAKEGVEEGTRA